MIITSLTGSHKRLMSDVEMWLTQFGFIVSNENPCFILELVESEDNLILHSGQSELSEYIQSLIADIGIYEVVSDKRLADRANLSVSAYSDLSDIECAALGKLIAYALKDFFE